MDACTPKILFEQRIQEKLQLPEYKRESDELGAIYQFHIDGESGGDWAIDLVHRQVRAGVDPKAQCTFSLSDEDLMRFVRGEISAPKLILKRRLKLQGQVSLALKLHHVLSAHNRA